MLLSVTAFTGEVFTVGVVAPAAASRFTYTLIGSRSGRIGAPSIMPTRPGFSPGAIKSVHAPPPWRTQALALIGRVPAGVPGGGGMAGASPPWSAVRTVLHLATSVSLSAPMSQPEGPRLSSIRNA